MIMENTEQKTDHQPIEFRFAAWWGFIFAGIFILYGGVQIILGVLDNQYHELAQSMLFAAIGIALMVVVYGYRALRMWGWYGLIGVNALIVLLALIDITRYESVVLLVIAAGALYALVSRNTRQYLQSGR
jgi:hypothetical protein